MMMFTVDYAALGKRQDIAFHQRWSFGWVFYILAYGFSTVVGIFLTFTIPGMEASETGVAGGLVSMMGILGHGVVFALAHINANEHVDAVVVLDHYYSIHLGFSGLVHGVKSRHPRYGRPENVSRSSPY